MMLIRCFDEILFGAFAFKRVGLLENEPFQVSSIFG